MLLHERFIIPWTLLFKWWSLTPPFHPYLFSEAVCFLWHSLSLNITFNSRPFNRLVVLWSPDFPLFFKSDCPTVNIVNPTGIEPVQNPHLQSGALPTELQVHKTKQEASPSLPTLSFGVQAERMKVSLDILIYTIKLFDFYYDSCIGTLLASQCRINPITK